MISEEKLAHIVSYVLKEYKYNVFYYNELCEIHYSESDVENGIHEFLFGIDNWHRQKESTKEDKFKIIFNALLYLEKKEGLVVSKFCIEDSMDKFIDETLLKVDIKKCLRIDKIESILR